MEPSEAEMDITRSKESLLRLFKRQVYRGIIFYIAGTLVNYVLISFSPSESLQILVRRSVQQ